MRDSVETDPEWAQAWARELKQRSDDFKSGVDKGIPWPVLRAQLEEKYRPKP
jgi:hypothetical protein